MNKTIEFTQDFATKKKGETLECTDLLASRLVRKDKVAKFIELEPKKKTRRTKAQIEADKNKD